MPHGAQHDEVRDVMAELDEAAIFNAARKIDLCDQRAAYLRQACGPDRATFERVVTLLDAYEAIHVASQGESNLEVPFIISGPNVPDGALLEQGT